MLSEMLLVFAAFAVLADATQVNICDTESPFEDARQVNISNCNEPPCALKQGTTMNVEIRLVPNRDIQSLTNDVKARIAGVPLPFVGVDGTNACEDIFNIDGSKAGCPLKAGSEYLYKNSFDVLQIYPRIALTVIYALRERNEKVACFEIPSKITK